MLVRMQKKWSFHTLLVEVKIGALPVENSMKLFQEIKNRATV